jgi:hypothetical protein
LLVAKLTNITDRLWQKLNIPTFGPCRGEKKKRSRYSHHHLFICPLISIIEDQMEEAKDLGMSSVCVSDEPNMEDIKSGKFHLIFGSAENVLNMCFLVALKYSSCHLHNRLVAFVIDESHVIETWTHGEKGKYKFKMHILFLCMSHIIFQTILDLSHKQSRYFAKELQNYLALLLA